MRLEIQKLVPEITQVITFTNEIDVNDEIDSTNFWNFVDFSDDEIDKNDGVLMILSMYDRKNWHDYLQMINIR